MKSQEHPFKIMHGDLMSHYPFGKIFYVEDIQSEASKFYAKDRVPTGLLCGKKIKKAQGEALSIEKKLFKKMVQEDLLGYSLLILKVIIKKIKTGWSYLFIFQKAHMLLN
jgi:hypothetical protein